MMTAERLGSDFGAYLREARQKRGVTLEQIASRTKISVGQLAALERNDISRLPGGIFTRAFVRSYAVEVGLDPEETVREFISRFPHDSVTAGSPHVAEAPDVQDFESTREIASTLWLLIGLSTIVTLVIVYWKYLSPR